MKDMIDLSLSGSKNEIGKFAGQGKLMLKFSDISKSSLTFDYSQPDKVLLKVDSSVGLKFSRTAAIIGGVILMGLAVITAFS